MSMENLNNKIEKFNDIEKRRENLNFDGFSSKLNTELLSKYYEDALKNGLSPKDVAHNLFVYCLLDKISAKYKIESEELEKLFLKMTEFDVIYRNERAYIGNKSKLSDMVEEILREKYANCEDIISKYNISLQSEIDDICRIFRDFSNEATGDSAEYVRHYFKGAAASYRHWRK